MAGIVSVTDYQTMQHCNQFFHTNENLLSTWWCYSNIEQEALRILHRLEKFQHDCFAKEVCVITDHIPLVPIISKDVAKLSHWFQYIMLCIHQYRVCIIYKSGPDLYIVDWLSQNNHIEHKDQEVTSMNKNMCAIITLINIPVWTSIEDIHAAIQEDIDL